MILFEPKQPCLKQMMDQYEYHNASIIGVKHVSDDEVSRYGIVDGFEIKPRLHSINHLVEKPSKALAPSNLAIMGRYILTPRIFEILNNQGLVQAEKFS